MSKHYTVRKFEDNAWREMIPITRCKECRFHRDGACRTFKGLFTVVRDEDYCSRAERKTKNEVN